MASTMSQAGDALGVCYRKRDHGKCDGPNCPYNHNAKATAVARAEERRSSKGSGDGKGKHGSVPNHACGEKGGQSHPMTPDGHRKEERRKSRTSERSSSLSGTWDGNDPSGDDSKGKEGPGEVSPLPRTSPRVKARKPREAKRRRPDGTSNPE